MMARSLLVLLLLTLTSGCALGRRPNPFDQTAKQEGDAATAPLMLAVKNQSSRDVVVYLVEGAVPQRLGRVSGNDTEELLIRRNPTGGRSVQLMLKESVSEVTYRPDPVRVLPGDLIELSVQPLLTTSHLSVRQSRQG